MGLILSKQSGNRVFVAFEDEKGEPRFMVAKFVNTRREPGSFSEREFAAFLNLVKEKVNDAR